MKLNQIENRFETIKNAANSDITDLYLYGDIGDSWWGESITDKAVLRALNAVESDTVNLHINSNGGDTFQGIAICNLLKQSKKTIHGYVDGIAASAASIILLGADRIVMPTNTQIMIHNPWTYTYGNADELEKVVDALRKCELSIIATYMERFAGTEEELRTLLDAETFLTAEEAFAFGLADEILENNGKKADTKNAILNRVIKSQLEKEPLKGNETNKSILENLLNSIK